MPQDDLTDDYVANLLKQDAKNSALRYARAGLGALLPKRPTTQAPKPNVRFLRNIIRETDTHNAALLAKEAEEAQAKLKDLRREKERERKRGEQREPTRKRRDDSEHRRERKRHKTRYEDDDEKSKSSRRERDLDRHRGRSRSRERRKRSHYSRNFEQDSEGDDCRHRSRRTRDHESKRKYESRSQNRGHRSRRSNQSRSRSRSRDTLKREYSRSKRRRDRSSSSGSSIRSVSLDRRKRTSKRPSLSSKSCRDQIEENGSEEPDSDPLEDIVGPLPRAPPPQVHRRGRGAFTAASNTSIDAHFAADYDPSTDLRPASDHDDDWEEALEAMRDRQKWKQQGADRLRRAGFSEDQVKKWETGGEKNEADVRWAKKGEGREWDRGKVVDTTGDITLQPEWGRLKGT